MRASTLFTSGLTLSIAALVKADEVSKQCPETDICYSLNIPSDTSSSGKGDIYFQIQAPIKYQWIGLGQGQQMAGANIFMIYTDASGSNITLSPRLGMGEFQPSSDTSAQVTLLDGTGVANGMMTANVKCANCQSWNGGSMDFTQDSTQWIHAYRTGDEIKSNSVSANLQQHDNYGILQFEKAEASGGSSPNPFVVVGAAAGSSGSSGSGSDSTTTAGSSGSESGSGSVSGSGSDSSASGADVPDVTLDLSSAPFGGDPYKAKWVTTAHGVLASVAWVIFFPLGSIIIRLVNHPKMWLIHAIIQWFAIIVFTAAVGLGIYLADQLDYINEYHPIIGLVLFALIFFQPILGALHHFMWKKHQRRFVWTYAHIWLGRILITLGMINGGLGLLLAADSTRGEQIAYGVVAGLIWVAYVASAIYGEMKRRRVQKELGAGHMGEQNAAVQDSSKEKITDTNI